MQIIRKKSQLRQAIKGLRENRKTIALVPTMGALHAGHLSLIELARQKADVVVVSIFVNPKQFGKNEDFASYPVCEEKDLVMLESRKVAIAYLPTVAEMYPEGYATTVSVKNNSDILCGAHRVGHFDGVATVVTKLLLQTQPDIAVFGEKDYQQLHIIKRLVNDLDIPVKIIAGATVREADGLALSSRNTYLSKEERKIAPEIFATLMTIKKRLEEKDEAIEGLLRDDKNVILSEAEGSREIARDFSTSFRPECLNSAQDDTVCNKLIEELIGWGKARLEDLGFAVDYLEIRGADALENAPDLTKPIRIFIAARLGKTRLIDNIKTSA